MSIKRYSRQRELIFQCLCSTAEHPTAEMLYHWLKPDNPALSLGTVYRNLKILAEEGSITRMTFPVERFDANTEPHAHFLCRACGCVSDLELPYSKTLDEGAEECSGHRIDGHELLFVGTCSSCGFKQ